jgi:predicted molibdopterin-dependent oxidoreductase YjgC
MERSMLGEAGYMTSLPKKALDGMIEVVKGIEPDLGYEVDPPALRSGSRDARVADEKDEDGVHVLRRGMQLRYLDS